jgi:hypothetical protein
MDYRARIDELQDQAQAAPYGPVRVALLDEAVRLADQHNDLVLGFELRDVLMHAAVFGGAAEKMLPAFAWSLAQSDRDPDRFPGSDLLWKYKWVMENMTEFPQVTRAQIDHSFADMEQRYQRHNASLRPVWGHRASAAARMGDPRPVVLAHRERYLASRRDWYADCAACESQMEVDLALTLSSDDPDAVLAAAAPITSGKRTCAEVPHMTYGMLLGCVLATGDLERADDWHKRGLRMCEDNPEFIAPLGRHLAYATARGRLGEAAAIFEKAIGWALETRIPERRLRFFLGARDFFAAVQDTGQSVRVRLPPPSSSGLPPELCDDEAQEPSALRAWFDTEAQAIAARFDARNGNSAYREQVEAPPLRAP